MTTGTGREHDESRPAHSDDLFRVRHLDPECDSKAVERFFAEIASAVAVLADVNPIGPLPVAFTPQWSDMDVDDD